MTDRNPLFDDIAKVAASAMSTVGGLRDEAKSGMKARFEAMLADMDMVTREEFEAVRAMALKAREENDQLLEEIKALRAALKPAPRKAPAKKPAARKPAAKKAAPKASAKDA